MKLFCMLFQCDHFVCVLFFASMQANLRSQFARGQIWVTTFPRILWPRPLRSRARAYRNAKVAEIQKQKIRSTQEIGIRHGWSSWQQRGASLRNQPNDINNITDAEDAEEKANHAQIEMYQPIYMLLKWVSVSQFLYIQRRFAIGQSCNTPRSCSNQMCSSHFYIDRNKSIAMIYCSGSDRRQRSSSLSNTCLLHRIPTDKWNANSFEIAFNANNLLVSLRITAIHKQCPTWEKWLRRNDLITQMGKESFFNFSSIRLHSIKICYKFMPLMPRNNTKISIWWIEMPIRHLTDVQIHTHHVDHSFAQKKVYFSALHTWRLSIEKYMWCEFAVE